MPGLEQLTWSFGPQNLLIWKSLLLSEEITFLPRAFGLFLISVSGHWVLLSWPSVLILPITQEQREQWALYDQKSLWAVLEASLHPPPHNNTSEDATGFRISFHLSPPDLRGNSRSFTLFLLLSGIGNSE